MARKSTDFVMVVHCPDNREQLPYQEVFDKFRLEQINKYIAKYPPKVQIALLEELGRRLRFDNMVSSV